MSRDAAGCPDDSEEPILIPDDDRRIGWSDDDRLPDAGAAEPAGSWHALLEDAGFTRPAGDRSSWVSFTGAVRGRALDR